MSTAPIHVEVTVQDLSLQALVDRVQADTAGAIATFSGVTRNNFDGRPVLHLDYEAYTPMAEKKLQVPHLQQRCPLLLAHRGVCRPSRRLPAPGGSCREWP